MRWFDLPLHPAPRVLREFAGAWLVFFTGLAAWQGFWLNHPGPAYLLLSLAVAVGPLGLIFPRLVRPLFLGSLVISYPIGWVVSHLALALVFFGVLTPLGLCFRLLGRDVLARRRPPTYDSYWQAKQGARDVPSYFRQS
jgi:hypothetical protein